MGRGIRALGGSAGVVALLCELALATIDILTGSAQILTVSYVVPVVGLSLVANGPRTAAVAVVACVLAVASGAWDHYFLAIEHIYRIVIVVGVCALSSAGAVFRCRAVRSRDGMEMLVHIGQITDGTRDLDEALERLAHVLVPGAADLCELTVLEEGGGAHIVALTRGDDAAEHRSLSDTPAPVARVAGGEAVLERLDEEDPGGAGYRSAGIRSVVHVPIRAGERTIAALTMGMGPSGRTLDAEDVRFALTVGTRAGLAIENARLLSEVTAARERLEAILSTLADAVTIRDRSGHVVYANDAALRQMRLEPGTDLAEREPQGLLDGWLMTDEAGAPVTLEQLPSMRVLSGEDEPEPLVIHVIDPRSGEEAWRVLRTTPLRDGGMGVTAAVTVVEDVTVTKRSEQRSAFLSRIGEILASSLDYEQTVRNTAQLAVPDVADWCAVDLLDEKGRPNRVATAHRDPAKIAVAERLRALEEADPSPDRALVTVLRTGEPLVFPEISQEALLAAAPDTERQRLLGELGMRSAMVVPLRVADRTIGAMTLVNAESGRRFRQDDTGFAEQIAARVAVAVENARLYGERSRVAATLQQSLLPEALPEVPGWSLASLYRPARSDGAVEVGGDFYDAFRVGKSWIVIIGDVTGKGVDAAAMTALVRHGARFTAEFRPWPIDILGRLDAYLRQQRELSLCTALCLRVDAGRVSFASAGHPLPLVVTDDGVRTVGEAGPVLGAFNDSVWPLHTLEPGVEETVLLYTDGVTDTVGADGRFGEHRLTRTIAECGPLPPGELLRCLEAALSRFQSGGQADDTAALALQRSPSAAGVAAPVVEDTADA